MTEQQKDEIRAKYKADNARMQDLLAPFYLGRACPWNQFKECVGMDCSAFQLMGGEGGKVSGGACCIPLAASQIGPIGNGLMALAERMVTTTERAPNLITGLK